MCAQNLEKAAAEFQIYDSTVKAGKSVSKDAYDALLRSHYHYAQIISISNAGTPAYQQAFSALSDMLYPLQNAVIFYNKQNLNEQMMHAARAYVDVATLNPALERSSLYLALVRLAAINTANQAIMKDKSDDGYRMSIPYLQAYIQTGDRSSENRIEQAYRQISICAYQLKDYALAYKSLKEGLTINIKDLDMLRYMLETLQHIPNKQNEIQPYLSQALELDPENLGLIKMQALIYQKAGDNEGAAKYFAKLHEASPYQRDVTRNLAFSYSSLGFSQMDEANKLTSKSAKKEKMAVASANFKLAAALLEELSKDEFNENERLRYTNALATIYAFLNETSKQKEMEEELKDKGIEKQEASVALASLSDYNRDNRKRTQPSTINTISGRTNTDVANNDIRNCDVDVEIPVNDNENTNTFVVIIANENYDELEPVAFAHNDGGKFREYCIETLGIPEERISYYPDATSGRMKRALRDLRDNTAVFSNANVIFYYAGHGMNDEKTLDSYLIPSDGSATESSLNYKTEDLYNQLSNMNCESIYVFMDACFSGSVRGDGMLISARGTARVSKNAKPAGSNMVIFSAAQGDETAHPYKEKKHGLFTYFLLKKLKETAGNVTLGELDEYITTNVRQISVSVNKKIQTPNVACSLSLTDNWKFLPMISINITE